MNIYQIITKIKKIFIIFLFSIIFAPSVFCADETKKLSLEEAIKLAVEKNLILYQDKKDVDIAQNMIKVANRLQNPEFQTLLLVGNTSIGNPQQFGLAWDVEVNKRGPRKHKAIAEKLLADTSLQYQIFTLKMNIREAYVIFAGAKSILKIVEQQKDILNKMVEIASRRFEIGVAPESEYLQAKIFLSQWNTIYNMAQNQLKQERYNFNKSLNLDEEYTFYDIADEELPSVESGDFLKINTPSVKKEFKTYEEVEKIAFENRKDIQIARQELEVAIKNLKVVISKRIPDITLLGGYMYLSDWQNNDVSIAGGGQLSGAYFGGNIDLPVLYQYTPEIKNAKLEIEKKEANLKSVTNIARQDIQSAYSDFMLSRQNLNYYDDVLIKDSSSVLAKSQLSYEVGKSNLSNLILMEQSHLGILTNYINSLAMYYSNWVSLLRELNVEDLD